MLFSSLIFLFGFLPLVLIIYYAVLRKRMPRNIFLTFASLFFYAWGEPRFVFIMIASILLNYVLGLLVHLARIKQNKAAGRAVIVATVAVNLALLVYYKYWGFLLGNINTVFGANFPIPQIALPIGISFFTFQAMSYVFDVYRGNGVVQKNVLNVALYISLFPQLIAGPIVRYETVAQQINTRQESMLLFSEGTVRFLQGMVKKILLANPLALIADHAFNVSDFSQLSVSFAILGAIAYTLQIYYDFSGYSDMAIGLGKMFGFKFLENFNHPYIATSITDFWRRWHISLSSWFRDYVYIPLGGSRVSSKGHLVFNLFVVWLLTGVWHGASWNFIAWGLFYFGLLVFEKLTGIPQKMKSRAVRIPWQVLTCIFVVLGWVLFRASDLHTAWEYIKALFGAQENALLDLETLVYVRENIFILLAGIVLATPVMASLQNCFSQRAALGKKGGLAVFNICQYAALLVLFFVCVSYLAKGSYNPFIYFNF